jgi:K(+)-stimulated pyrophosphate-energized sodium pump
MINVLATEGGYQVFHLRGSDKLWLLASGLTALLAIGVGFLLARSVLAEDPGTQTMQDIAKEIQVGAQAYLRRQFKTIIVILIPLVVIVFLTSTKTVDTNTGHTSLSFAASGVFRALAFVAGGFLSGLTGFIGMTLATRGNVRTAAAA